MYYSNLNTPAGELLALSDGNQIIELIWTAYKKAPKIQDIWEKNDSYFTEVKQQLDEYFAGKRQSFSFKYSLNKGTEFQKAVWQELVKLPFGTKTSYKKIAQSIGRPTAVRAVGTAVGKNPISIAVPCHRVLTANSTIGGYAGGLDCKKILLETEKIKFASS